MVTLDDIKILREFFGKKGIDFVLTGTMGLYIHGLLPEGYEPEDIDIIVIASQATHQYLVDELLTIQKLTGGPTPSENYENECFTFRVGPNNTNVNVILYHIDESLPFGHSLTEGPIPTYIELTFGKKTLKLHSVDEILKAKFHLKRPKDYMFCNKLMATFFTYFK